MDTAGKEKTANRWKGKYSRLDFPPLSGKTTSLQDYIKTITLAEEKLKGVFMTLTMILAVGRVLGRNFYECLV